MYILYRIFPAVRRGFRPSRKTSNKLISPMKFCYNTNSTLPKQCQSSRSVLQDRSRTFGLFWKEKKPRLIPKKYGTFKLLVQSRTGRSLIMQGDYFSLVSQELDPCFIEVGGVFPFLCCSFTGFKKTDCQQTVQ